MRGRRTRSIHWLSNRCGSGRRNAQALTLYRKARDLEPKNPETWYELGAFELRLSHPRAAYRDLNHAYTLDNFLFGTGRSPAAISTPPAVRSTRLRAHDQHEVRAEQLRWAHAVERPHDPHAQVVPEPHPSAA